MALGLETRANELQQRDRELAKTRNLLNNILESMQRHCLFGCEILGPLGSLQDAQAWCSDPLAPIRGADHHSLLLLARTLALLHHERFDGQGYPFGLEGEDIPLEARIVAVVDVYDALRSTRTYKAAFSETQSLEILRQGAGTQFDPQIVAVFFAHLDAIRAIREKWKDEEETAP